MTTEPLCSRPKSTLVALVAAAVLLPAGTAQAESQLVRIVWDVGKAAVYYTRVQLDDTSIDNWPVPSDSTGLRTYRIGDEILQPGDLVRLYIVNYNAVAHVHESTTATQIVDEPSTVAAILNAAVLAITGAAKLPSVGTTLAIAEAGDGCGDFDPNVLKPFLDAVEGKLTDLLDHIDTLTATGWYQTLQSDLETLSRLPGQSWGVLDSATAWGMVGNMDFPTTYHGADSLVDQVPGMIAGVTDALLTYDRKFVLVGEIPKVCDAATVQLARRKNLVNLFTAETNSTSRLATTVGRYKTVKTLWSKYQTLLDTEPWTASAVEIVVKEAIKANSTLRLEAVFKSPNPSVIQRQMRSLTLRVQADHPGLLIGGGAGFNSLDLKTLELVKIADTDEDSTVSVKNRLRIVDDGAWEPVTPVWLMGVKAAELGPAVSAYITFGTTPDKNIFRNAILGGSLFVPRARTAFTVGAIGARGFDTDDLRSVIDEFSDADGFALKDVTATNIPLPAKRWLWSPFVSVTFMIGGV